MNGHGSQWTSGVCQLGIVDNHRHRSASRVLGLLSRMDGHTMTTSTTPAMTQSVVVYDGLIGAEFFCSPAHMVAQYAKEQRLHVLGDRVISNATVWPDGFVLTICEYCGAKIE